MKLFFAAVFCTLLLFSIGKAREIGDSNVCCDYFMDVCMGLNCDDISSCCYCDACIDYPSNLANLAVQNLGHCKWLKCATKIAECAVACCAGGCTVSTACVACLGSFYEDCKSCWS